MSTVYRQKKLEVWKCKSLSTWARSVNKPLKIIALTSSKYYQGEKNFLQSAFALLIQKKSSMSSIAKIMAGGQQPTDKYWAVTSSRVQNPTLDRLHKFMLRGKNEILEEIFIAPARILGETLPALEKRKTHLDVNLSILVDQSPTVFKIVCSSRSHYLQNKYSHFHGRIDERWLVLSPLRSKWGSNRKMFYLLMFWFWVQGAFHCCSFVRVTWQK